MSDQSENPNPALNTAERLDELEHNSKTRRQRLDAAKASFERLLSGSGQRSAHDADEGAAMFEAEPARPSMPNAIENGQPGVQVPEFRATSGHPDAMLVSSRKRKHRLRDLFRRKRKKVFF